MTNGRERRAFSRIHVRVDADVTAGETRIISNRTKDVSFNGVFVYAPAPLPKGSECTITLHAAGGDTPGLVHITGVVTHVDEQGMGIEFSQGLDAESVTNLRNLILLSAEEPETVEREFYAHVAMHRGVEDEPARVDDSEEPAAE